MTDELVKRWDDHVESLCSPMSTIEHMAQKMRNRIEALTAERDGLLRCVTDNHVALCRAEAAEAERDRLRRALHYYADFYSVPSDGPWGVNSKDFGTAARAALKGESDD